MYSVASNTYVARLSASSREEADEDADEEVEAAQAEQCWIGLVVRGGRVMFARAGNATGTEGAEDASRCKLRPAESAMTTGARETEAKARSRTSRAIEGQRRRAQRARNGD